MSAPEWVELKDGEGWEYGRGDHKLGTCWFLSVSWEATVWEEGEKVVSICFTDLEAAKAWVERESRAREASR